MKPTLSNTLLFAAAVQVRSDVQNFRQNTYDGSRQSNHAFQHYNHGHQQSNSDSGLLRKSSPSSPTQLHKGERDAGEHKSSFLHPGQEGGIPNRFARRTEILQKKVKSGDSRIIGGDQSAPGEFPYFVDLGDCGGSLIASDVVLTAAHCTQGFSDYYVGSNALIGAYEYQSESNGAEFSLVVDEVMHPEYDSSRFQFDFLLLRLNDTFPDFSSVRLTANESPSLPSDGEALTVMGLGTTTGGLLGTYPDFLHDVEVTAIDNDDCFESYGVVVDDSMICAGGDGKGFCDGDSGGPLVIRDSDEHHIQVGIVSVGFGCTNAESVGIYARVSSGMDWIKTVVCDEWGSDAQFCDLATEPPVSTPGPTAAPVATDTPTYAPTTNGTFIATLMPTFNATFDNTTSCDGVNETLLVVTLLTDDYGDETAFFLANEDRDLILDESNFANNEFYEFDACIDLSGCTLLNVFDWYGDGISPPGGMQLRLGDELVFDEPITGFGEVFQFGDACRYKS